LKGDKNNMFKVIIRFEGTQATLDAIISRITKNGKYTIGSGIAYPSNSYADSAQLRDSIYDKNVFGFGSPDLVPPYNEWGVPVANILHKFNFTTPGQVIMLTNVDSRDAAFYRTLQSQLAGSGFVIEIIGEDDADILPLIDIGGSSPVGTTTVPNATAAWLTVDGSAPEFSLSTDSGANGVQPRNIEVTDRFGNILTVGRDYVLRWANNNPDMSATPTPTFPITATVTVAGIRAYKGALAPINFTIVA
jgi:hypothetical protein